MKTTLTRYDFERAFTDFDRKENFSYEGLKALFDYLEDYEEQTGEEIELDVIALCCDYTEDTAANIARNYAIDLNDADPEAEDYEDQRRQIVFDYLSDRTSVVGDTADGFVYANF